MRTEESMRFSRCLRHASVGTYDAEDTAWLDERARRCLAMPAQRGGTEDLSDPGVGRRQRRFARPLRSKSRGLVLDLRAGLGGASTRCASPLLWVRPDLPRPARRYSYAAVGQLRAGRRGTRLGSLRDRIVAMDQPDGHESRRERPLSFESSRSFGYDNGSRSGKRGLSAEAGLAGR